MFTSVQMYNYLKEQFYNSTSVQVYKLTNEEPNKWIKEGTASRTHLAIF